MSVKPGPKQFRSPMEKMQDNRDVNKHYCDHKQNERKAVDDVVPNIYRIPKI